VPGVDNSLLVGSNTLRIASGNAALFNVYSAAGSTQVAAAQLTSNASSAGAVYFGPGGTVAVNAGFVWTATNTVTFTNASTTNYLSFSPSANTWASSVSSVTYTQSAPTSVASSPGTTGVSWSMSGQAGGATSATAGTAGSASAFTITAGAGGAATGTGATVGGNGGNLVLSSGAGGTGTTAGANGYVQMQSASTTVLTVGEYGLYSAPSPSITITTGTVTLTAAQYRYSYLVFTGTLTANVTVVFPVAIGAHWILDFTAVVLSGHTISVEANSVTSTTHPNITTLYDCYYGGTGKLYMVDIALV
jgi:hypothetical protein